jgi:hypothetical protein
MHASQGIIRVFFRVLLVGLVFLGRVQQELLCKYIGYYSYNIYRVKDKIKSLYLILFLKQLNDGKVVVRFGSDL